MSPRSEAASRRLEVLLSGYAIAVFAVLWVGLAVGLVTDGALLGDAWAWLTGLPTVAAIVVWVLILPIAIGLWAWTANLGILGGAAVVLGLVAWTGLALSGLRRRPRAA